MYFQLAMYATVAAGIILGRLEIVVAGVGLLLTDRRGRHVR